ncbi:hypothetical protein KCU92_g281, partial [Aureobasidium melanogenum]
MKHLTYSVCLLRSYGASLGIITGPNIPQLTVSSRTSRSSKQGINRILSSSDIELRVFLLWVGCCHCRGNCCGRFGGRRCHEQAILGVVLIETFGEVIPLITTSSDVVADDPRIAGLVISTYRIDCSSVFVRRSSFNFDNVIGRTICEMYASSTVYVSNSRLNPTPAFRRYADMVELRQKKENMHKRYCILEYMVRTVMMNDDDYGGSEREGSDLIIAQPKSRCVGVPFTECRHARAWSGVKEATLEARNAPSNNFIFHDSQHMHQQTRLSTSKVSLSPTIYGASMLEY